MEVSQTNFKQNSYKRPNILGSFKAQAAMALPQVGALPINLLLIKGMSKANAGLTKDQVELINNGSEKVLSELTNLKTKGVNIVDASNRGNLSCLTDSVPQIKKLPKTIVNMLSPADAAANGANAFFSSLNNSVTYNKEKFSLSAFHEMGYAFNFNNSAFWKTMQQSRMPLMLVASLIATIPAITKEAKAQDGKELTTGQKVKNFIRNSAPVASMVTMLGVAAEEAMATIRGNQWAKQVLDPTLAKKVAKTNAMGFVSYALSAVAIGLGAYVAKKVKDASDEKRANKA